MSYKINKKDFFKDSKMRDFVKTYLIDADDHIFFDKEKSSSSNVFFQLTIKKRKTLLSFKVKLYSWSNDTQKYVPLKDSNWMKEDGFGYGKYIVKIKQHYEKIVNNFFKVLNTINKQIDLKEFIYRLENPTFVFHYKLLNLFSQRELENIIKNDFDSYPLLNLVMLKESKMNLFLSKMLLPKYIKGFYIECIEVSVDLDQSDIAKIEDLNLNKKLTKKEFLKYIA